MHCIHKNTHYITLQARPKATKKLLVGYRDDAAYRLIDPQTHKITYSRDVVFDEIVGSLTTGSGGDTAGSKIEPVFEPVPNEPTNTTIDSPANTPQHPTIRRSERLKNKSNEGVNLVINHVIIPKSAFTALQSEQAEDWRRAMEYEIKKLDEMGCWELVEKPWIGHVVKGMWVFAVKEQADGSLDYRAAGSDFITARIVIAISGHDDSELVAIDINSAYLHSPLDQDNLFVEYPTGFEVPGFAHPVCRLKKALYGLKQGARAWSDHSCNKIAELGYTRCRTAPSVYVKSDDSGLTLLATHVNDCTAACVSQTKDCSYEGMRFKKGIEKYFTSKRRTPAAVLIFWVLRFTMMIKTGKLSYQWDNVSCRCFASTVWKMLIRSRLR